MADVFEARYRQQVLLGKLEAFNARWINSAFKGAVYQLPIITNQQRLVPPMIAVKKIIGAEAFAAAQAAFVQMERIEGNSFDLSQHPGSTFRLPGWIAVSADLQAEVAEINALKEELGLYLRQVKERARPKFNSQAFPRVNVLQLLRHVQFISGPLPYLLSFTWIGHSTVARRMTRDEAKVYIMKGVNEQPVHVTVAQWQAALNEQVSRIDAVPAKHEIVYRRPQAPHPRLELIAGIGQLPYDTRPAPLPALLYCPEGTSGPLPLVTDLADFDFHANKRKEREGKQRLTPVIPSIGLFERRQGLLDQCVEDSLSAR